MHWEAVLVSCRHLVKFLFYTHFSTVNRIFEGSFLSNHLGLCRASLKPWFPKKLVSFLSWVKSLACRQLPPNQDIDIKLRNHRKTAHQTIYIVHVYQYVRTYQCYTCMKQSCRKQGDQRACARASQEHPKSIPRASKKHPKSIPRASKVLKKSLESLLA